VRVLAPSSWRGKGRRVLGPHPTRWDALFVLNASFRVFHQESAAGRSSDRDRDLRIQDTLAFFLVSCLVAGEAVGVAFTNRFFFAVMD